MRATTDTSTCGAAGRAASGSSVSGYDHAARCQPGDRCRCDGSATRRSGTRCSRTCSAALAALTAATVRPSSPRRMPGSMRRSTSGTGVLKRLRIERLWPVRTLRAATPRDGRLQDSAYGPAERLVSLRAASLAEWQSTRLADSLFARRDAAVVALMVFAGLTRASWPCCGRCAAAWPGTPRGRRCRRFCRGRAVARFRSCRHGALLLFLTGLPFFAWRWRIRTPRCEPGGVVSRPAHRADDRRVVQHAPAVPGKARVPRRRHADQATFFTTVAAAETSSASG